MLGKKTTISLVLTLCFTTYLNADIGDKIVDVSKHAMDKMTEVALQDKTDTKLTNVDIQADVKMQRSAVLGDVGSHLRGDSVEATNVTLDSKVDMKESVVVGNVGASAGSR